MATKNLSATITIGGALSSAFKTAMGSTQTQLKGIGSTIRELNDRNKRLGAVATHWEKMGRDASKFRVEIGRVNKELERHKKIGDTLKARDANLARRGELRGQLFDAVGLGMLLAAPVRSAMQLENTMADIRKVVDFDTPVQFKQMEQDIVGMTRRLPMAADQIGAIVAAGGQAGIARKELLAFAEDAVKMGIAFDISADEAGQMMAEFRTAFKMSQRDVVVLTDKINFLGNTTAASAPRIAEVVRRVGPLGEVAGLASGEVAALGATLISMGVREEIAATGLQNLFLGLVAGESATKAQRQAFDSLGMSATDVAARMQTDAKGAILDVLEAIKLLPEETQAATLQQLFGRESIKAIAPLLNSTDKLVENLGKVGDATAYAGSMTKEYEARAATTANGMQLFRNRVSALGVAIGNVLLPGINGVLGVIGPVFDAVADLANKLPTLTAVVVGATAGLIGLKIAAIAGGYAFTFIKGAWLTATLVGTRLVGVLPLVATGIRAIGVAMAANPIGLAISAIALAAGLIYTYWEPIKGFFTDLWGGIVGGARAAFDWVIGKLEWVGNKVMQYHSMLGKLFSGDFGGAIAAGKALLGVGAQDEKSSPPKIAMPSLPSPKMATVRGGTTVNAPQTNTFNITQQPGQDSRQLADEVARRLDERDAMRRRSASFDPAMGY